MENNRNFYADAFLLTLCIGGLSYALFRDVPVIQMALFLMLGLNPLRSVMRTWIGRSKYYVHVMSGVMVGLLTLLMYVVDSEIKDSIVLVVILGIALIMCVVEICAKKSAKIL